MKARSKSARRPTLPTTFSRSTTLLPRRNLLKAFRDLLVSSNEGNAFCDAGSPRSRDASRLSHAPRRARPKSLSACSLRSIKIITGHPSLLLRRLIRRRTSGAHMDILPQDFLLLLIEVKSAARSPQDVIT